MKHHPGYGVITMITLNWINLHCARIRSCMCRDKPKFRHILLTAVVLGANMDMVQCLLLRMWRKILDFTHIRLQSIKKAGNDK